MTRQHPADTEGALAASRLPLRVQDRIRAVVRHSGLSGNEQIDVVEELVMHFHDGIASGRTPDELLDSFGDEHVAGTLIAKAKRGRAGPMRHVARLRKRGDSIVATLRRNVRYAFRRLVQSPGFTVTALLSLALGIGANTAIFTVVNAVLLRPLPLQAPEELVDVYLTGLEESYDLFSYPDYRDLRESTRDVFTDVAATRPVLVQVEADGGIEMAFGEVITGTYFPLLGVPAQVGRTFGPDDDIAPGAHPVVMLNHGYWQRAFAGDPEVIGRELRVSGRLYTIVGVMPEDYPGSLRGLVPDVYLPFMMINELQGDGGDEFERRGNHGTWVKARLQPGVTMAQVQASLDALADRLQEQDLWNSGDEFRMVPTKDVVIYPPMDGYVHASAWLLMSVVGLVLFIACTNLASFLLARALDRRKEIAVRLALGATRRTLIGQLLTEATLLGLLGGAAGVAVGAFVVRLLVNADIPLPLPITLDLRLDSTVLGFSVAASVAAALLFGLVPALQATNADVAPALKDENAGLGRSGRLTLRNALVGAQMTGSLVLLVCAGLFIRNLNATQAVDPGFGYQPAGMLTIGMPSRRYDNEAARTFQRNLFERFKQLPGVDAVGLTTNLHLNKLSSHNVRFQIDGVENPPDREGHTADWAAVDAGFFDVLGIGIVRGRTFQETDVEDGTEVVIINEAFAERFWPGQDPIGKRLRRSDDDWQVVGVAANAKIRALNEAPRPFVYRPYSQAFNRFVTVLASTQVGDEGTAQEMLAVARELDPELWLWDVTTMRRHLDILLVPARLSALLLSVFAGLALTIASIGLYGIVSYAVAQRTREVGIRMSLGANDSSVIRLLLGSGMKLVAVGGVIGMALAFVVARSLQSLLIGIDSFDAATFVVVPMVLGGVAAIAAYIPARRASGINPITALRAE